MIVVLKNAVSQDKINYLYSYVNSQGLDLVQINGLESVAFGINGDVTKLDIDVIKSFDFVESVVKLQDTYKKASRKNHKEDTIIDINGIKIGGGNFAIIAGPCSIESEEQIVEVAKAVKDAGTKILRGGAFKPRTSPYTFRGLGESALEYLKKAKELTGMPIVSEIMSPDHIDAFKDVDILQIGARNMQNYELLKCVGKTNKPVLLKRGISATIEEFLMSAEYIMAEGNPNVILCERGIRTFEQDTRSTLDISAIPVLKEKTHLPIIVDPSHASGLAKLVEPLSLAAVGAGADGLMVEVHSDPTKALCDGMQSITPNEFETLSRKVKMILPVVNKQ